MSHDRSCMYTIVRHRSGKNRRRISVGSLQLFQESELIAAREVSLTHTELNCALKYCATP